MLRIPVLGLGLFLAVPALAGAQPAGSDLGKVYAPKHVLERLTQDHADAPAQLGPALAAFAKADAQLAVVLPDTFRKAVGELLPNLPKEAGGGKTAPLLKGFQYFAAGITFTPK